MGHDSLLAEADWPTGEQPADCEIERRVVADTCEDVRDVIQMARIEDPARITLTVVPAWKFEAHEVADDDRRSEAVPGRSAVDITESE